MSEINTSFFNEIVAITEHRKMWEWIARNIMVIKPQNLTQIKKIYITCVAKQGVNDLKNDSYLCEYVIYKYGNIDCEKCIANFGDLTCFDFGSLYNRIVECIVLKKYKKATKLAYKISKIPLKCVTVDVNSLYPKILPFC